MSKEASVKSPSLTLDRVHPAHIAKIFIPCDQKGIAPIWGYIFRQPRLNLRTESSIEKAADRGSTTMPNNVGSCSL